MCIKISAKIVKELRDQTGAGMMNCKKALLASEGNIDIARENLRKQGLASANKKAHRRTSEGLIDSYIHPGSRIGVLVELNCETDFVARHIEFTTLAKNLSMQIVACPEVKYISMKDIPDVVIQEERRIESMRNDIVNKLDHIKDIIVKGRLDKRLKELSLLDQPFIKNTDISVADLIDEKISLLGENIRLSRFKKFILGQDS